MNKRIILSIFLAAITLTATAQSDGTQQSQEKFCIAKDGKASLSYKTFPLISFLQQPVVSSSGRNGALFLGCNLVLLPENSNPEDG